MPLGPSGTLVVNSNGVVVPDKKRKYSTSKLGGHRTIRARIGESIKPIRLSPDGEVVLGRAGDAGDGRPDVDITGYSAFDEGVSRLHTALRLVDGRVEARDLKSTNGTFINDQRVSSTDWRPVRDGDRLRLGELELSIHFEPT